MYSFERVSSSNIFVVSREAEECRVIATAEARTLQNIPGDFPFFNLYSRKHNKKPRGVWAGRGTLLSSKDTFLLRGRRLFISLREMR